MERERLPVVLIGSLFHTDNPYLVGSYMSAVQEVCHGAYKVIPEAAPVMGAINLGIRSHAQK